MKISLNNPESTAIIQGYIQKSKQEIIYDLYWNNYVLSHQWIRLMDPNNKIDVINKN